LAPVNAIEIGIVIYPEVQQSSVLGLTDLFGVANRIVSSYQEQPETVFRVTHWQQCSIDAAPERVFDNGVNASSVLSALILPPSLSEPSAVIPSPSLKAWLCEQHAQGVILGSICAGAFILAETGLMSGRRMTTHWAYADQLTTRFPNILVDVSRLLIDDGDIITAGGLLSWTDLGLRLIDRLLGSTVMISTARMLLVDPPGREQRYYSVFSPKLTHGDTAVLKVQHWLHSTQAKDISLATLASQANLEERTFLRRFQKATGMTTTDYCQNLRVGRARELLQFGTLSIERVAWEVGYNDTGAFRKVFTRIVGLSPSEYRSRFSTHNPINAGFSS